MRSKGSEPSDPSCPVAPPGPLVERMILGGLGKPPRGLEASQGLLLLQESYRLVHRLGALVEPDRDLAGPLEELAAYLRPILA